MMSKLVSGPTKCNNQSNSNFYPFFFNAISHSMSEYCDILSPKKEEEDFRGLQNTIIIISSKQHKNIDIASSDDTSVADYTA